MRSRILLLMLAAGMAPAQTLPQGAQKKASLAGIT